MPMTRIMTVTTPAEDRSLLDARALRKAVGIENASSDVDLKSLGARISAAIVRACGIVGDGVKPPTLRKETITEILRPEFEVQSWGAGRSRDQILFLSRRFVQSIASITVDDTALSADTDFECEPATGMVYRLSSGTRIRWSGRKIVVVYDAGFDEVPDDLQLAASRLASIFWNAGSQDTNIKLELIQDVGRTEYFGNVLADGALPGDVLELLEPYKTYPVM